MTDMIDQILEDAERELGLDKEANDENGSPENNSHQINGEDIFSLAQNFLAKVEQFKQTLVNGAAANGETVETEENLQDPNSQQNLNPANPQVENNQNASIVISRPDGTHIKLASLHKLASFRGRKFLGEV